MSEAKSVIVQVVQPVLDPKSEDLFFRSLIDHLYLIQYDSNEADSLIRDLYIAFREDMNRVYLEEDAGCNIEDVIDYLNKLYLGEEVAGNGLESIKHWTVPGLSDSELENIKSRIEDVVSTPRTTEKIFFSINESVNIVLDYYGRKIIHQYMNLKNRNDYGTNTTVINAYPAELEINESVLDDMNRTFTIKWISHGVTKPFTTREFSIKELEDYLKDGGFVITPKYLSGCLASAIQAMITKGLATINNDIKTPGFYRDSEDKLNIKIIDYEFKRPNRTDLKEAAILLDELVKYFTGAEDKLATGLKWGWMSPFSYIMKQTGKFLPWLYLYGKAGSGKTTLGQIILNLWCERTEENDIGGGSFDTVARVGKRLSQSTFPLVVNEPKGAFNRDSVVEVIKSSVERTSARGRYEGKNFKNISALSPVIFTANQYIPRDDALLRRLEVVYFSHNERKTAEEKKDFDKTFMLHNPSKSRIAILRSFSNYFLMKICESPSLLSEDWKETSDKIIRDIYQDLGLEVPSWLLSWSKFETIDDLDDEVIEDIRMFFIDTINRETRNITIYDEIYNTRLQEQQTFRDDVKTLETCQDLHRRAWNVLNERKVPWAMLVNSKYLSKDYVVFTKGIKRDMDKAIGSTSYNLKSLSELLNWEYKTMRLASKESPKKVMRVEFEDFVRFIYPSACEVDLNHEIEMFEGERNEQNGGK